jgi:hypothetical protein
MKKIFAIILSLGLIIAPMPVAHAQGEVSATAKQLLGMANGIIGAAILTKCPLGSTQPSVLAYLTGSLVFVAAEIAGGKKKQSDIASQSQSLDATKMGMKEGGDYQMAGFNAQIKDEESTLDFIKKRRKWMMATKVVYGLATALAIMEKWMALPPPAGLGKPDKAACIGPSPSHTTIMKGVIMAYSAAVGSGGSLSGMAKSMGSQYLMKGVGKVAAKKAGEKVVGEAGKKVVGEVGKNTLENGLTITTNGVDAVSVPLLNSAFSRIAFFGAATAVVMMIDSDLKKEEDASVKKIADLKKVRDEFKKNTEDENALAEGESEAEKAERAKLAQANKQYALKALPQGTELAKNCFSNGSGGAVDYSEAGCKNPIKLTKPSFNAKFNIPALTAGANTATDMANAISSGDVSRAEIEAGNLANQAGRIDLVKNDLMKKLNDQLVKEGKKPIDIKGELNRQIAVMNKDFNAARPGSGNFTLADVNGGEASVSETAPTEKHK